MKMRLIILSLITLCALSGCMTITKQIQTQVANASDYPPVAALNEKLSNKPPFVDITKYKSVETSPMRPYQRSDMAVAVAASGGGYRATNLVVGVLMGLEKFKNKNLKGNLLEEVDYFSSVSGGGFGVGYYLARYQQFLSQHINDKPLPHFSLSETVAKTLAYPAQKVDGVYTGRGNVLNVDLSKVVELGGSHYNEYESTINTTILNQGDGEDFTLGDLFVPKADPNFPTMPLWVPHASIYQNMAIFPFTPGVMAQYQIRDYWHMGKKVKIKSIPKDPYYASQFPLSVALSASATVPFAMQSATLQSSACHGRCYLQLFDGGLTDNLGIIGAYNMLLQDKAPIKLLIVVDASGHAEHAFSQNKQSPGLFSMLWRVMNSGIDASRILVRNSLKQSVKALMCQDGASNVLIAYLDLDAYPQAYKVPTSLHLSLNQQEEMLNIGQQLVAGNKTLQMDFMKLLNGDKSINACPEKIKALTKPKSDAAILK